MAGIEGFGNSPFKEFQFGQSIKQSSEANILAAQSDAKRSPVQNLKSELRVDTTAPITNAPLQKTGDNGGIKVSSSRGSNLDISA